MATVQTHELSHKPPLRRPTEAEIRQAREAIRQLETAKGRSTTDQRSTIRDAEGVEVELPPLALVLLDQILNELAQGNAVELEPVRPLLTLAQAGEILGVSEAFVTKLIDDGELPCRIERDRPWIVFEDLMAYRAKCYEERSKILDKLVAQAQELGLGY